MSVHEQIDSYITDQTPAKSKELQDLHRRILAIAPDAKLWFLDGRNDEGKVVSSRLLKNSPHFFGFVIHSVGGAGVVFDARTGRSL